MKDGHPSRADLGGWPEADMTLHRFTTLGRGQATRRPAARRKERDHGQYEPGDESEAEDAANCEEQEAILRLRDFCSLTHV
jgi:hypothetical protein